MARIRSIKPEFWSSDNVVECSTNARLLFIGLWNFCDDKGRHTYSPKQIKALVFPSDDFAVNAIRDMLDELSRNGLIKRYAVDGKEYFYVTGWHHQRIDKPQKPKFPEPPQDNSKNDPRPLATDRNTEGRGSGEDKSPSLRSGERPPAKNDKRETSKTTLGETWSPDADDVLAATAAGLSAGEIEIETKKFRAYYHARGETRANWSAAWESWCLKAKPQTAAAKPASDAAPMVTVREGTPEWDAWQVYYRATAGKGSPCVNGQWRFPSLTPPKINADAAA